MLDFRKVGADLEGHRKTLGRRPGFDTAQLDRVQVLWERRNAAIQEAQSAQEKRNAAKADMQRIFKSGTAEEKEAARADQKHLSARIKELEHLEKSVEEELDALMLEIPNVPHESIPDGEGEEQNEVVRVVGDKPTYDFEPKDHVSLAVDGFGLMDFERAAKLTGSRFVVQYGLLAKLERALGAFMLDVHAQEHDYTEVSVPLLVNSASLTGTGQLPKFADDQYRVPHHENTDYWLIPTAEVPLTNLHADEILEPDSLPRGYVAHTPCFRKEAGSAGRDTRGIMRQHQFYKVEMVRFCEPSESYNELENMVGHAEAILQKLELHYRVSVLSTGDISANAAKCYDLEVWLPGQDAFREISSVSNFEDFQARRAKIRYRAEAKGKAKLLHTLNGSGIAVGRAMIAVLEQHQQADGSVKIPKALVPYFGSDVIKPG